MPFKAVVSSFLGTVSFPNFGVDLYFLLYHFVFRLILLSLLSQLYCTFSLVCVSCVVTLSLQIVCKLFKNRYIFIEIEIFYFDSPVLSHLFSNLTLCPDSWAWYKTKYLIGSTSLPGEIYEKHNLHSRFLKSNEVLINGITSPVGLNDDNLSKQRRWKILWVLRCGKVEICQSP